MSRKIKVAAVQMDANPAPLKERLTRADKLVTTAARAGAQLVVLPELFNTGYAYRDANFRLTETLPGETANWMRETAARLNIHLAGSLMLRDHDEVYNALLLFAPDGHMWRYDKSYPWGWERAYFREGNRITVAQTDLGDFGMMICWDTAHPELWRHYAGRVDMILIASCPPDVSNPTYHFPNGDRVTFDDMGPIVARFKGTGEVVFDDLLKQQTAWLGVPTVNTVGAGHISTALPNGLISLLGMLPTAPWLAKYLPQADLLEMSCDMTPGCRIVDARGEDLAKLTQAQGEAFTIAEVALPDEKLIPSKPQPVSPLPASLYFVSDIALPLSCVLIYRRGLRRVWGERMAPLEAATRRWSLVLGLVAVGSFIAGMFWGRVKSRN